MESLRDKKFEENRSFISPSLRGEFIEASKQNDAAKIAEIKERFLDENPGEAELAQVYFGLHDYLVEQRVMEKFSKDKDFKKENWGEFKDHLRALTAYNYLLTDFVMRNGEDRQFLEQFWNETEDFSGNEEDKNQFKRLRSGITTQVATMKIFEKAGLNPGLSTPEDDAFNSVDMWTGGEDAVQVKSGYGDEPIILPVDTISFPGARITYKDIKKQGRVDHISSSMFREIQRFHAKVSKYRELKNNENIHSYFVVIPRNKIDNVTGEPSSGLVETVKRKFDEMLSFDMPENKSLVA
jgi:hypothetical protein